MLGRRRETAPQGVTLDVFLTNSNLFKFI